jgi:hypothetical protein
MVPLALLFPGVALSTVTFVNGVSGETAPAAEFSTDGVRPKDQLLAVPESVGLHPMDIFAIEATWILYGEGSA